MYSWFIVLKNEANKAASFQLKYLHQGRQLNITCAENNIASYIPFLSVHFSTKKNKKKTATNKLLNSKENLFNKITNNLSLTFWYLKET